MLLPRYQDRCLTHLLPSIEARLSGTAPIIDLPGGRKYVVFLVDGLGELQVRDYAEDAEWMGGVRGRREPLTSAVPSTTATSLSSLGTGRPPGEHGIVGYSFLDPAHDQILNALTWEGGPVDVDGFRCSETWYSRLNQLGHATACISLARFEHSALQQLAFHGTRHYGVEKEGDVHLTAELLEAALAEQDVIYCYERRLDHIGHSKGVGSWQWLDMLAEVDDAIQHLTDILPDDVVLIVTGDHGMINIPAEHRIVIEDQPALDGWRLVGGEGRFRQIYTRKPAALARRWQDFLGERAHVLTRDEAVGAGWFGPVVSDVVAERIGDVVVAMLGDWALMSTAFPKEFSLVGMHGSLSPEEMTVPLLTHGGIDA